MLCFVWALYRHCAAVFDIHFKMDAPLTLGRLHKSCCQQLWQLKNSIGRSPAIEFKSNRFYRALFLVLNRVRVKIGPRQGDCLGLYTRVYEIMIWAYLRSTQEARSGTEFDD